MLDKLAEIWADRYFRALIIFSAGFLLAVFVDFLVKRVGLRLVRRTRSQVDDEIVAALHRPVAWTVALIGLAFAIDSLKLGRLAPFILFALIKTVAVFVWTAAFSRLGTSVITWFSEKPSTERAALIQPRTVPVFTMAIKIVVYGSALYALLLSWEINVTGWLASAGILGLAIGFAAKDSLANLFAGVFILADGPYKLGDFIQLEEGTRGRVSEIGIRSTRIVTLDDIEIVVPNSKIANGLIVNVSGGPRLAERVPIKVGVAYGSDIDLVRKTLFDVAENNRLVLKEPAPLVQFTTFGDSSLDFELLCWVVEPRLRYRAIDELNTAVYKRFAEAGIEIPFPQRDVHLKRDDDEVPAPPRPAAPKAAG